jgi:hypothetical protein
MRRLIRLIASLVLAAGPHLNAATEILDLSEPIKAKCGDAKLSRPCPELCREVTMAAFLATPTNWTSPLRLATTVAESTPPLRHIQVGSAFRMARWGGQRLAPHTVKVPPLPPLASASPSGPRPPPPTIVVTAPPHARYIAGTSRLVHMLRAVLKSKLPVEVWACDEREMFPPDAQRQVRR